MASTASVMRAVVKNKPKTILSSNEYWNLDAVLCLSKSVNLWKKNDIASLSNITTKNSRM